MNKLLKVNMKLMMRRLDVRVCAALGIILAIFEAAVSKHTDTLDWYGMFEMLIMFAFTLSAVGGLFISRDYSLNTIRNKLTVGHKRTSVYLANQIAESIFFCIPVMIYFITSVIADLILIGAKGAKPSDIIMNIAVALFAMIALSALTTFISMTVKNSAGGVLPLITFYPMLMLAAMAQELELKESTLNLINSIPIPQLTILFEPDKDAAMHILSSIAITVVFIFAGTALFRRSDLK